jgi:hypothetical protein
MRDARRITGNATTPLNPDAGKRQPVELPDEQRTFSVTRPQVYKNPRIQERACETGHVKNGRVGAKSKKEGRNTEGAGCSL